MSDIMLPLLTQVLGPRRYRVYESWVYSRLSESLDSGRSRLEAAELTAALETAIRSLWKHGDTEDEGLQTRLLLQLQKCLATGIVTHRDVSCCVMVVDYLIRSLGWEDYDMPLALHRLGFKLDAAAIINQRSRNPEHGQADPHTQDEHLRG